MWPWGHLAVGYLLYSAFARLYYRRPPGERGAIALAVGTQFPDLIDKPLAWSLAVLPHGRSLAHSLFTVVAVVLALRLLLGRSRSDVTVAFGFGYVAHLFADAINPLLAGEYVSLRFLLWPVLPAFEYETRPSFTSHILGIELTPFFVAQIAVFGLVAALWIYDGAPGLETVKRGPRFAYRQFQSER